MDIAKTVKFIKWVVGSEVKFNDGWKLSHMFYFLNLKSHVTVMEILFSFLDEIENPLLQTGHNNSLESRCPQQNNRHT